jgi:CRP/FNR family cyclic AMP-dependent transcriptional regulator
MSSSANATNQIRNLEGFGIFRYMTQNDISKVVSDLRPYRFEKGNTVVRYNEPADGLYLVGSGLLIANQYSSSGLEVGYRIVRPGSYTGELGAIDGLPRSANLVCIEPAVIYHLAQRFFDAAIHKTPGFSRAILEDAASMIRSLSDRLFERTTYSAQSRVVLFLIKSTTEAEIGHNQVTLTGLGTHAQIASLIGTQREVVTRELAKLESLDFIKAGRNTIKILKYHELKDLL